MAATSIKYIHINFKHKNPSFRPRKRVDNQIFSMKMDGEGGGDDRRLVDQNLIVLRKRIHEIKMKEESHAPPSSWWRWEKKWHELYGADVIEIVGLVQISVMNGRPSLVLVTGAVLVFCMVMAMYVMLCGLVGIVGHALLWVMGFMQLLLLSTLAI